MINFLDLILIFDEVQIKHFNVCLLLNQFYNKKTHYKKKMMKNKQKCEKKSKKLKLKMNFN